MNHTNTAVLSLSSANLIRLAGRIQENELWVKNPVTRGFLTTHIEEEIRKIADWAGFDIVKREATKDEAKAALSAKVPA